MARKINKKPTTRVGDDIESAEPGDYCYYLNASNKPGFAEIQKVFSENSILVFHLVCQAEYKFLNIPAKICAFEEKALKGKKRSMLCPEVYGAQ